MNDELKQALTAFAQKGLDLLLSAYSKIIDDVGYPLYIAGNGGTEAIWFWIGGLVL